MTAKSWPSSTASKRPGTRPARASARAITSSATPSARAGWIAASAFDTLNRPGLQTRDVGQRVEHGVREVRGQPPPVLVVDVHDLHPRPGLEQPVLGGVVVL